MASLVPEDYQLVRKGLAWFVLQSSNCFELGYSGGYAHTSVCQQHDTAKSSQNDPASNASFT